MKRKKVPDKVKQRLFVHTGNQCAMPNCTQPLYEGEVYLGEIAHIYPVGGKGEARYDPSISEEFIDSYENLLVVCRTCHPKVDFMPTTYTAEDLFATKAQHETSFPDMPITDQLKRIAELAFEQRETRIAELVDENKRLSRDIEQLQAQNQRLAEGQVSLVGINERDRYTLVNDVGALKELRRTGQYRAVLTILQNEKSQHWQDLSAEDRFRLQRDLALAAFTLNDYTIAASELTGLVQQGDHKGAEGLAAIGYYLLGDFANARHQAMIAIEKAPDDPNGYVCLLKANRQLPSTAADAVEIPEKLKRNVVVEMAEANRLEESGHFKEAYDKYAKVDIGAIEDEVLKYDLIGFKGTSLMQSIRYLETLLKGARHHPDMDLIDESLRLFDTAIGFFSQTDLMASRYYLLTNRGIAKKLKGLHEEAMYNFGRAFELHPSFSTFKYLLVHSPYEKWDEMLQKSNSLKMSDYELMDLTTMDAERLVKVGQEDEALAKLQKIGDLSDNGSNDRQFYYLLLGDLLLNKPDHSSLEELITHLTGRQGVAFPLLVLQARKALKLGDRTFYENICGKLLQEAESMDHVWARSIAYQVFKSAGDYGLAATILRPICNPSSNSIYTRDFIESLYLAGNYKEAANWINQWIDSGQEDDLTIDIASQIYEYVGNRELAIATIEKYLQKNSSYHLRAKLASLYSLSNDPQRCAEQLKLVGNIPILNTRTRLILAAANILCGREKEGLDIAYELSFDMDTAQQYLDFIYHYAPRLTRYLPPEKVRVDSVVLLERDGHKRQFILVQDPKRLDEIAATDNIAFELLGGRKGDQVVLCADTYAITEIHSKYAFAFRACLEMLQAKGKENPNIFMGDEAAFDQHVVDQKNAINKKIKEDYENGAFLEVMAKVYDGYTGAFWLEQLATLNLRPPVITEVEKDTDFEMQSSMLFDFFSVLTLYLSGQWDSILALLATERFVPRQVLRDLDLLIHWLRIRALWSDHEQIQIALKEPHRVSVKEEATIAEISKYERLKAQIEARFMIIDPQIPEKAEKLAMERKTVGTANSSIEHILTEKPMQVISEDRNLRQYLRKQYGINSVSVGSLAMQLTNAGRMGESTYSSLVLTMANLGFINFYVPWSLIQTAALAEVQIIGSPVHHVIAAYLKKFPLQQRVILIGDEIANTFSLTCYSDDALIEKARRLVAFYLLAENNYHSRVLLSNRIENTPHVPSKIKEAVMSRIRVDIFEPLADEKKTS